MKHMITLAAALDRVREDAGLRATLGERTLSRVRELTRDRHARILADAPARIPAGSDA